MKLRPRWSTLISVELLRCRLRPVLGRLPLLGGAGAAATGVAVGRYSGPPTVADLTGALAAAAAPMVLLGLTIGAGIAHDLRTSGIDLLDRALVGRPRALALARSAALAAWGALACVSIASALVAARLAAAATRGDELPAITAMGPVIAGAAQLAAAVGATTAVGFALARACGSPTAAVGVFLVLLLVGDGVMIAAAPPLAALALPDNLLALGAGRLEGLAVRGEPFKASALRAVIGTTVVVAAAAALEARRDAV